MDVSEVLAAIGVGLSTTLWMAAVIAAPGWMACYLGGARFRRVSGALFASLGFGIGIQPALAFVLDATVGISGWSLGFGYGVLIIGFFGIGTIWRVPRPIRLRALVDQISLLDRSPRKGSRRSWALNSVLMGLGAVSVLAIALANWSSGVGVHSVDMGWHLYWGRTVVASGHLPDYSAIEPFDQASKFTFGAHFLLATFEMVAGLSMSEFFWIPIVLVSTFTLLGGYVFGVTLTNSRVLGWAASGLVASGYLPGGFVQRGNLPDILGFFLIMFLFWVVANTHRFDWHTLALLVGGVGILHYHQLALVVFSMGLLAWLLLMAASHRTELRVRLLATFLGWRRAAFWVAAVLAIAWAARQTTYLNPSGVSVLTTSQWAGYVPSLDRYFEDLGFPLLFLGFLGYLAIALRRRPLDLVVGSWILVLLLLANSPLIGLHFEPTRFLMRLTEPLAVASALGIAYFGGRAGAALRAAVHRSRGWRRIASFLAPRHRQGNHILAESVHPARILVLAGLLVGGLAAGSVAIEPPRYHTDEPLWPTNVVLAEWLSSNADTSKYIIVNVDVQNTGTWIQALSMKPHFLYKVDFAAVVSPPPYLHVYVDLQALYANPDAAEIPAILSRYNIGYVIVDAASVSQFTASPFFQEAFDAGPSRIFVPASS